jgi:hypothetical protein
MDKEYAKSLRAVDVGGSNVTCLAVGEQLLCVGSSSTLYEDLRPFPFDIEVPDFCPSHWNLREAQHLNMVSIYAAI